MFVRKLVVLTAFALLAAGSLPTGSSNYNESAQREAIEPQRETESAEQQAKQEEESEPQPEAVQPDTESETSPDPLFHEVTVDACVAGDDSACLVMVYGEAICAVDRNPGWDVEDFASAGIPAAFAKVGRPLPNNITDGDRALARSAGQAYARGKCP